MEDHQLFVFGKLDVQFDPVSVFHSIGEGSHGIFRNGLILCKKASVGEEMMEESLGFLLSGKSGHYAVKIETKKHK